MTAYERMHEVLNNLTDRELRRVWNEYCYKNGYTDDIIYLMEEFSDIMKGKTPLEVAYDLFNADFNPNDDYFHFDSIGNLESTDWASVLISSSEMKDLAEYIVDNGDTLYNAEIRDLLNDLAAEALEEEGE